MSQPDHSNHFGFTLMCHDDAQFYSVVKNAKKNNLSYEFGKWLDPLPFGQRHDSIMCQGAVYVRQMIVVMSPENPNAR